MFHLATANIYGYHRDEFYYLASGRRLAWSYVDHPPLTPLLYRVDDRLFGTSPFALRVVPALLHGLLVVLVVLLTRELGGIARAQLLAALGAAVAPMFLTTGHFLGTVTVELSAWTAIVLLVVKLLNGGDQRLWVLVGVAVGVAMFDKSTTVFLVVALVVALLLLPQRSILLTPWVVAGAGDRGRDDDADAAVAGAPGLAAARVRRARCANYGEALLTVPSQFVLLGAVSVLLALPGLLWLLRDPAARPVPGARGRVPRAARAGDGDRRQAVLRGGVRAGADRRGRRGDGRPDRVAVAGADRRDRRAARAVRAAAAPVPHRRGDPRRLNPEIGEMVGWPHLVDIVADVYARHPGATILTENYSEAGSIELLGADRGLPQPISGHNTYWYWGHPHGRSDTTIAVGFDREFLEARFGDVERAATFHAPAGRAQPRGRRRDLGVSRAARRMGRPLARPPPHLTGPPDSSAADGVRP